MPGDHGLTAERLGQPSFDWGLAFARHRAQITGDPERAEELATEAFQIGADNGEPDAALIFGSQLALASLPTGHHGRAGPID